MTELLVVVAIVGVLAAIGVPSYNDYISSTKRESAKNGLRMIHNAQLEYRSDTGAFCAPAVCASTAAINAVLFGGQQTLDVMGYSFSVTAASAGTSFTAQATSGSTSCSVDQTGAISGC